MRNYQPNDDIHVLYVCLQARMDIYHLLDINQCTPKATKQRTNNHDLLNNEPKLVYWFTTALAYIQHQLTNSIIVQPFNECSLNEKAQCWYEKAQSGGVKVVVVVLETNIKGIISGNGAALIQRKKILVPISSERHLLLSKKNKNSCLYSLFH